MQEHRPSASSPSAAEGQEHRASAFSPPALGFRIQGADCRTTGFQSFGSRAAVEVQEHGTSLLQPVLGADSRSTGVQR